jgi:hypothetical protein
MQRQTYGRLVAAGILVVIGAIPGVFAKIAKNTIDPTAVVTDDGGHIIVTGPIECTPGERAYLEVTVTQRTTGAIAEGRGVATCTGLTQQWDVDLEVRGSEVFDDGPSIAVAVARSVRRGVTTDAHQWLVPVTLSDE